MKIRTFLALAALILVGCDMAQASRGGRDDRGGIGGGNGVTHKASFAAEAIEHSLQRMVLTDNPAGKDLVTDVAVTLVNANLAQVEIKLTSGGLSYDCSLFDDFSRGGTEVKKEVRCNRVR